jgi:hypothetical protein
MKSGFARYRPGEIRELPLARRSGSLCGDDRALGVFSDLPLVTRSELIRSPRALGVPGE